MPARSLVVVPHTHWDREWYRTRESFRYRLVRLLDALLDTLEADPGFRRFTLDGQTIVLADYLEIRPAARERIAKLVADGRLWIGPWTVLPDEWLVSGEALVRNLRAGLAYADGFGGGMQVGYVPDQFGHVGQLPQIFAGFGFECAVLWRGVGADVDRTLFDWEAPDGTRVFTAYLRNGYGNAVHLPREAGACAARLRSEVAALEDHSPIATLLLMNGSDHVAPEPDLPGRLAQAAEALGLEVEIGSLPDYLARARAEAPEGLPLHRGELRSGLRSPLLAGCASSRMRQKRADFENDRLLSRHLEPLAAWLERLGGDGDAALLEAIWRIVLENHPHDSICGCSIDAVHDEMDTRFQRVRDLATAHLVHVTAELSQRIAPVPGEGTPLHVWNPHGTGPAEARGVLELPLEVELGEAPALHVADAAGRVRSVPARVVRASVRYADYRMPARAAAGLVRGFPPEFFGDPVCLARRVSLAEADVLEIWLGEAPPPGLDWERRRTQLAAELEGQGERPTHFRPLRLAAIELRLADTFPGTGLRSYRLRAGSSGSASGPRVRCEDGADGLVLENEALRLSVSREGRVRVAHRSSGRHVDDFLRLVSEADRGDSYSFDPLPDAPRVERPDEWELRLGACSEARGEACIDARYRVPASLREDRAARSEQTRWMPARIVLALVAGQDRIDVRVECENTARDHRLRLHLRAPFAAEGFEVESAFEVVPRPIGPPAGDPGRPAETASGASPQRRFATLRGDGLLLCAASQGLAEAAAVTEPDGGSSLALTLLRATGWLSRDDLVRRPGHAGPPLATPGGQVPGRHVGEWSVLLRPDPDAEHRGQALRCAEPPFLFGGSGGPEAPLRDGARLLEVDDPELVVSAIEPLPEGGTGVRLHDAAGRVRTVEVAWNGGGPGLERTDLRGRPLPGAEPPQTRLRLRLRAHEILTLRAR